MALVLGIFMAPSSGRTRERLTTPSSATAERGAVAAKVERREGQRTWDNATTGRDAHKPE